MRTGEVAARAGVNVETLRYYERRGVLAEPERSASGYRTYSAEAVRVVRFVKRAQELGFSLADVQVLLELANGGPASCDAVRRLTVGRIADLDSRIDQLVAMRDGLRRLTATCDRPRGERDCPLLNALDPKVDDPDGAGP